MQCHHFHQIIVPMVATLKKIRYHISKIFKVLNFKIEKYLKSM